MKVKDILETIENPRNTRQLPTTCLTSLKASSFGGIAILLLSLSVTSACTRPGTGAADQTTQIGDARPGSAASTVPREEIVLQDVQFNSDGSRIRPGSQPVLDRAADLLKGEPARKFYVDAFCDPVGGKRLNLRLSEQRAAAVARYLEERGVAPDRLIPRGFGAANFVASNDTAIGRAQNRRVELVAVM